MTNRPADERPKEMPSRALSGLYAVFAGALVLLSARVFYSELRRQLFYSWVRGDPYALAGDWSAPLDDVFIHFDFARSAARGYPFQWIAGNGFSSGGTSLLYPLALTPGYWMGFRGLHLMEFAAVLATLCTLATLLASPRLFRELPPATIFLGPPFLLSIGALSWSLWSGMEVAFFLAIWGACLVLWDDLVRGPPFAPRAYRDGLRATALGVASALLVATRPEAIVVVLVFSVSAAWSVRARRGHRPALVVFALSCGFAGLVLVGSAIANKILTGDFSAAGALVKLEAHDPRLTARDVWDAWLFHVRYQVARVTGRHVAEHLAIGSLLWVLAAIPLFSRATRRYARVLWSHAVFWVLIVALNGQVRWQNERYTMPALAWMLLSAALGVGLVVTWASRAAASRPRRVAVLVALSLVLGTLGWAQASQMRDQIWFFGRASRNIRDQHVIAARRIRHDLPQTQRVLVGDAGAIPYAGDMPALDIIGLGGYARLPFARAGRWGVAASVELIQRIPKSERPDLMAIYPGWWGDFPLWFGTPLGGVSVRGNVICGGLTKMIYATRWNALDSGAAPATPTPGSIVDEIDPGDVVNEPVYRLKVHGAPGFVTMKLLPHPQDPKLEVWDAGRVLPPASSLSFVLRGGSRARAHRLVLRVAPEQPAKLRVAIDGAPVGELDLLPSEGWIEPVVILPRGIEHPGATVTITVEKNEVVVYHLWNVEGV